MFIAIINKLTQKPFIFVVDRGEDSKESDNLFVKYSSDKYQSDKNDYDDLDLTIVDNKPKEENLKQRSANDIFSIRPGKNDAFNE